ncbi:intercellular trafficking and secretion [Cerrena zonata]|uniref:Sorting nexin-4 n=1 Tax=Cerrena zonata TaxID=2478898 RepID=A0AAW0FMS4_9APHY
MSKMSAEDTFTSIQWDRGEESQHPANERAPPATISEGENDDNDTSLPVNDVQDANSDADINVNNVDDGEADEIEDGNPLGVGDLEDTEDNNEDEYADDADPSNSLLMTKGPSNDSDRASDDKGDADVNSRDHSDNNHPNQDASIKSLHSNNLESAAGDKGNIDLLGSPAAATSGGYEKISDKLKKLYENLLKLDKIFTKLNKKNHDLSQDYEQFANQISKLSIIQSKGQETGLGTNSDEVNGDATESSKDQQQFTDNFKVFAQSLSYFSNNWASLHKYIDESFLVSLKDCSKYIISLTNLIELQHNKKIDLQVLQDYLNKSRGELASFGGRHATGNAPPPSGVLNGNKPSGIVNNTTQLIKDTISTSATPHIASSNTDGKLEKLQHKIEQLENEIKLQTDLVQSLTNKIINEEYPNWDKFNKNELKQNMVGLCNEEIKFYKGLVDNWSDVEVKLMSRLEELK